MKKARDAGPSSAATATEAQGGLKPYLSKAFQRLAMVLTGTVILVCGAQR